MTDVEPALLIRLSRGEPPGDDLLSAPPAHRDAVGWALKAACHDAWSSDPARVGGLAQALSILAERAPTPMLAALAAWTAGLAAAMRGEMAPAVAAFDAARDRLAALGRPAEAAQTQVPKLMALAMLGRHDEALACARDALAAFDAGGDARSAGKVELNLASMLLRQERYRDAEAHYRRAAVRFARLSDTEHSVMADIGLATALSWQYRFDAAGQMLERAHLRAAVHDLPVLAALARGSLGQLALHRGELQRALHELEASARALAGAGSPQRHAEAERALADAYLRLNLWPEAQALLESVASTAREHEAPVEEARARVDLAHSLARQGRSADAAAALVLAGQLFRDQTNEVGVALAGLRHGLLRLGGGQSESVCIDADAAAATFVAAGVHGWHHEARRLAAAACRRAGRVDEALVRLEQGRHDADSQGLADAVAAYDGDLAALHEAAGRSDAAWRAARAAVRQHDDERAALADDELRSRFGVDKQAPYELLVRLAAGMPGADVGPLAEHLLRCIEHGRAPALALGLASRRKRYAQSIGDSAFADRVARERLRWRWIHHQWQQAMADGDATPRISELERQARSAESALLESLRRARAASADETSRSTPRATESSEPQDPALAPWLDVDALIAALPPATALVNYHVDGERWWAVVVQKDGVRRISGDATGLAQEVNAVRFQIDTMRQGGALSVHSRQLLQRAIVRLGALHRRLLAPLTPMLSGVERLVIVPHGILHGVPFAALHDGRGWLIERCDIGLAPSASAWLDAREAGQVPLRRALIAAPSARLPHTQTEARSAASRWGSAAVTLSGDAATVEAVRQAAAEADLLHLACHGAFRKDNPAFSSLQLADGSLTVIDAAELSLPHGLVVLSACETGSGHVLPGDEVLGLVRGFMLGGAASVVATLWTVDDASTCELVDDFYARLAGGSCVTQALGEAQRTMLRKQVHPYYWAAFTVHGHG